MNLLASSKLKFRFSSTGYWRSRFLCEKPGNAKACMPKRATKFSSMMPIENGSRISFTKTACQDNSMRLPLNFLVCAFCLSLIHGAFGEQLQISRTNLTAHIEQPGITSILRSRIGYLWVGTQDGLYKFDGTTSTTFGPHEKSKQWIPSSNISSIGEDGEGNLFLATYTSGLLQCVIPPFCAAAICRKSCCF